MIYAYVKLTITNPEPLAKYRAVAAEALARHGGSVMHASTDVIAIDGQPDLPDVAVLLSFPDKAAALGWINDPELTDVHDLRRSAGHSEIVLLG